MTLVTDCGYFQTLDKACSSFGDSGGINSYRFSRASDG